VAVNIKRNKWALLIFWLVVFVDIVSFLSNKGILTLVGAISFLGTYYYFRNLPKDYWFNVYFFSTAINGTIFYLVYFSISKGILGALVLLAGMFLGHKYFKRTHNKIIPWILYSAFFIVASYVTRLLIH